MHATESLNLNPRNNYKAKLWFGEVYVMNRRTHKVIYSCKKPKLLKDITNTSLESPRDIFCDIGWPSSYKYFSHGTEILGLEMDDKCAEIIRSSGKMEINQYFQHRKNVEKIVKQTKRFDLKPENTRHLLSFYFNEFIEKDESPKKFKKWLRKQMKNYDSRSLLKKTSDYIKYLFLPDKNSV